MSRYIEYEPLMAELEREVELADDWKTAHEIANVVKYAPSIDICFCRECKHRPIKEDPDGEDYGFNIIKPNGPERCPCLVEDGWYSWMPKDNFFCGYGEREDE